MTPLEGVRVVVLSLVLLSSLVSSYDTLRGKQLSSSSSHFPSQKHPHVNKTSLFPSRPPPTSSVFHPDDTLSSADGDVTDHFDLDTDEEEEEEEAVRHHPLPRSRGSFSSASSSSSSRSSSTSRKRYALYSCQEDVNADLEDTFGFISISAEKESDKHDEGSHCRIRGREKRGERIARVTVLKKYIDSSF